MATLKLNHGNGDLYVSQSTIAGLKQDYKFVEGNATDVIDSDYQLLIKSPRSVNFDLQKKDKT